MSNVQNTRPRYFNQVLDFLILGLTFYLSCLVLSVDMSAGLAVQTILYASILIIFMRLARRWLITHLQNMKGITRQILGNAAGIVIGTCVMLLFERLLAFGGEMIVALIFSGVMAFFILGTLTPLVNNNKSSSVS